MRRGPLGISNDPWGLDATVARGRWSHKTAKQYIVEGASQLAQVRFSQLSSAPESALEAGGFAAAPGRQQAEKVRPFLLKMDSEAS